MDVLARVVVWLNAAANALGRSVLAPVAVLPWWLSATLISAATGVLLLVLFKYTSHQRAIKRVRADINAQLLALKLFKESAPVALRAQGRILLGAAKLLALAVVPMLAMVVPVLLLLAQLALWYEARPLRDGEDAVVTMKLNGGAEAPWPDVRLEPSDALEVTVGPVRVHSRREICWDVKALSSGYHRLVFLVDGRRIDKELAVGDGSMRVSTERPGWSWSDALLNPSEEPFGPDSPVRSVEIDYPPAWKVYGVSVWLPYWFVVSLVAGLCFRRLLNVNI
jgi:hypothetical protein